MIHTWSDLFAAIKRWFDTPLDFKRKEEIEPLEPETAKKINDLMAAPKRLDWNAYYERRYRDSLPSYYRDPYYQNLKQDDSCWQDDPELVILKDHMERTVDPIEREERRKELIKKIREKYGLDHP